MADEMLQIWGVKEIRLLTNNPLKIEGLKARPESHRTNQDQLEIFGETQRYMEVVKKQKMGHYLDL